MDFNFKVMIFRPFGEHILSRIVVEKVLDNDNSLGSPIPKTTLATEEILDNHRSDLYFFKI
jgi:hypothetical protein